MDERTSILVFVLTLARYYPREITYNITLDRILTTYIICYFVHDLCFLCVTKYFKFTMKKNECRYVGKFTLIPKISMR